MAIALTTAIACTRQATQRPPFSCSGGAIEHNNVSTGTGLPTRSGTVINQQVLAGNWNEVSGKLKKKWGKLTDDDVRVFSGNVDQLVGTIQRKTGETRASIEEFLDEVAETGSSMAAQVRDRVQEGAAHMSENVREQVRGGYEALTEGYEEAERMIQERPGQTIAVAFGLGLVAGLGVALMFREPHRETSQTRATAERFGKQMLDAIAGMMPR
jgi:uncharacterized protein YjbJ (UPF0337 family)